MAPKRVLSSVTEGPHVATLEEVTPYGYHRGHCKPCSSVAFMTQKRREESTKTPKNTYE